MLLAVGRRRSGCSARRRARRSSVASARRRSRRSGSGRSRSPRKTGLVAAPGRRAASSRSCAARCRWRGRASRRMRVAVTFERRGMRRLEPARLVIADPLGLLERTVEAGAGQEVLVLPRIEPVVALGGGAGAAAVAAAGARPAEVAAEIEMESLRPYREGAPASRIHWPTVARVGTLMERRLLADSDSHPLVVARPDAPRRRGGARHGRARRRLALRPPRPARGAARCSCRATGARSTSGPTSATGPPLHVRLALVDSAAGAPAARLEARRGAIFWVTARRAAAARARAAAGRALPRQPGRRAAAAPPSRSPGARASRSAAARRRAA